MTTVVEEGNRRIGEMTRAEVEQCVLDIKAWFARKNESIDESSMASTADLERMQKTVDNSIPYALEILLRENNGIIYIYDKKLLTCREIIALNLKIESSPGFQRDHIPFCGDSNNALIIDSKDRVFEWDEDDGVGDMISSSFTSFLESYRNLLLGGHFQFISGVGVVETSTTMSRK